MKTAKPAVVKLKAMPSASTDEKAEKPSDISSSACVLVSA